MGAPRNMSGWTIDTFAAYSEALRMADERFWQERDRRYREVNLEKEKALKIKEEADKDALSLAREIQTYKDTKANELREQIASERGNYATKTDLIAVTEKIEATMRPLISFVASQQGKDRGIGLSWAVVLGIVTLLSALYAFSTRTAPIAPPVYYAPMVPGTLAPVPTPPAQVPR